jgi:hypothetical protein
MYRKKDLGSLVVDEDLVVFSLDKIREIAELLNISDADLIEKYQGVRGDVESDGKYTVAHMLSVLVTGKVIDTIVITGSHNLDDFVRFLQNSDPSFNDFLNSHESYDPENPMVNYKEIVQEYRQSLLG